MTDEIPKEIFTRNIEMWDNGLIVASEDEVIAAMREAVQKGKEELIWEMIHGWQDSRDKNEDLDFSQFSYNDIEIDLYEFLNKLK